MTRRSWARPLAGALSAVLGLAGCSEAGMQLDRGAIGHSAPAQVPTAGPEVVAQAVSPYGTVLTTGSGYALYVFAPDQAKRVTCSGECAVTWPPLYATGPVSRIAGRGIERSLLGTIRDGSGKPVVTYAGWPLYRYAPDAGPGFISGQGLDSDGGYWYLISATGTVVKPGS